MKINLSSAAQAKTGFSPKPSRRKKAGDPDTVSTHTTTNELGAVAKKARKVPKSKAKRAKR
jgi:hypothetical protein